MNLPGDTGTFRQDGRTHRGRTVLLGFGEPIAQLANLVSPRVLQALGLQEQIVKPHKLQSDAESQHGQHGQYRNPRPIPWKICNVPTNRKTGERYRPDPSRTQGRALAHIRPCFALAERAASTNRRRIHRNHRQQPAHFRAPYRIERERTDHGRRDDAESCIFADGGTADGEHHRIDQLQGGIADHGDAEKYAHDHEQTLECQSPHALPVSPRRHTTASSVMHVLRYSATTASERDNCHDEPSWAS